jgi:hypothetical protein
MVVGNQDFHLGRSLVKSSATATANPLEGGAL